MNLFNTLDENINYLTPYFGIETSFDIVGKEILIGEKRAYLLSIKGFTKDNILTLLMQKLQELKPEELNTIGIKQFIEENISYNETELITTFEEIEDMLLTGSTILIIDGQKEGVMIDAKEFPMRGVTEPELEKVTRGPRDGFIETLVSNTALIRRRVRDKNLRFEQMTVGTRSKTTISLAYIDDLVDKEYIDEIKQKIDSIQVEAVTMSEKTLSELLIPQKWYNPLPQARYTERPDVAAAHLFEGHLLIMVDNSPSLIILPTTIFHFTQHIEDYYYTPIVGTYIRWVRVIAILASLFLSPLLILGSYYKEVLPGALQFVLPTEGTAVTLFFQLVLLEVRHRYIKNGINSYS